MAIETVNKGQISAFYQGTTAPSNKKLLWFNTSENMFRIFNFAKNAWEYFFTFSTLDNVKDINADYVLQLTDFKMGALNMLRSNETTDLTITIPSDASVALPVGATVHARRRNTGRIRIIPGAGVTIESLLNPDDEIWIAERYGAISLVKEDANFWTVLGNIEI